MQKKDKNKQKQQLQKQQQTDSLERKQRQEKERLQSRNSLLIQYGLVEAFEYFMLQLAQTGVPQNNIFEFAAQTVLKYEKGMKKKHQQIQEINQFNHNALKIDHSKSIDLKSKREKVQIHQKNSYMELSADEKKILSKLPRKLGE